MLGHLDREGTAVLHGDVLLLLLRDRKPLVDGKQHRCPRFGLQLAVDIAKMAGNGTCQNRKHPICGTTK